MDGEESRELAPAASSRKLSALPRPSALDKAPSSTQLLAPRMRSPSLRRIQGETPSPLRRPSTATSTHSRIHQALRRSESEFVFSSKESTVDGLLYSSRFQQPTAATLRPASSQPRTKGNGTMVSMPKRESILRPANKSPPRPQASPQKPHPSVKSASVRVLGDAVPLENNEHSSSKHRSKSSAYLQRRQHRDPSTAEPEDAATGEATTTTQTAVTTAVGRHDELAYVQRKRRCARTFEEMIFARIQAIDTRSKASVEPEVNSTSSGGQHNNNQTNDTDNGDLSGGIDKLLANGIIPSLLALSALSDQATQSHCCRSLYYLSRVHSARKPLVTHGVIAAVKLLARAATALARQDLAALLCHLCEESGLVEAVLFEGIDRCLVRLFATTDPETKRVCALTVFNISSVAGKIKHFVDAFSQLLISSTKSCYGHTAASNYLIKAVYNVARLPMFHASLLGENIPRFLAAQIPHATHDIQILALQALVSLCDAKPNRAQILSQPFCKLLEKMVTVENKQVQEMALLVVLLLSQDEGSRIKLCNWIPVGTLIQTASARLAAQASGASTSPLVFLDSCILRNLCDSVLTHHELLEERAMPLLLALSRVVDHDVKSNAVCALVSIIASSPEESAEFVVDILDELITLARSPQPRISLFAIGAVYNIACNDDCLPLLVTSSDLIDCLLELARDATQDAVAELTAAVVYRLLTLEPSVDETPRGVETSRLLLQRGFFTALVRLAGAFATARPYAVHALYLLAQSEDDGGHHEKDASPRLFPHGSDGVWELMGALSNDRQDGKPPGRGTAPSAETEAMTARSAVTLLAVLARQRVNHALLVKNGAVFRFLRSLRRVTRMAPNPHPSGDRGGATAHDDETIVMNSAFVFYSLAVSHEGCEQLIREQGIEELIHVARTAKLVHSGDSLRVKELFMMTMCRVSSFLGLEGKLIEHGAIDAVMVLALVSSADSAAIKALCVKTLANCLVAKHCARSLIEHGVIWALASLATVDSPETRSACAVSLCNLATVPHMLARFLDAGAPRALVHILQRSAAEPTTALVVVKAIANLVANEKLCLAFVNEEIEKHLGVFFASAQSAMEMRQLAAMVLLRVTSANDAVLSLDHLKHGVFVWMEQIITMEDDSLVKNCLLTVHDLTCSTTVDVAEMDVDHILRIVVQVFQRHASSGDVRTMCLWILYNLSCHDAVLTQIVRPEILAFLRDQVPPATLPLPLPPGSTFSHANMLSASASTLTLINTASPAQQLDAKLCCYILHNLSCARGDAKGSGREDVLATLVNARCVAVLSDLYVQRDELKETCAVAVCNIAVGRVNSTRVVDDRAGDLVVHFVFSALFHRCHYRLASVAIRKMVNAPGNQPVLLHRGVVRAIVRVLELVLDAGCTDLETTRNLIASLCVLSKCATHLTRLLQDGALPIVIAVSECKAVGAAANAMSVEILAYCFEILSELCSVDFETHTTGSHGGEINVITTLTRLSELHQLTTHTNAAAVASAQSYYERGDDATKALAFAPLLTCMKKTPASTNSVKKNLELVATFQVPARKWMPDAQATPREPPPLECGEIALTEGSQAMPDEIKQRVKGLPALGKELLVRDERCKTDVASAHQQQQHADEGDVGGDSALPPPNEADEDAFDGDSRAPRRGGIAVPTLLSSRRRGTATNNSSAKKQLQRGHAGRNLSLASATSTSLLL